jgi:hypothetical protein
MEDYMKKSGANINPTASKKTETEKVEVVKPVPIKAEPAPVKVESPKPAPVKLEPPKPAPVKVEPVSVKVEPPKQVPAKPEPVKKQESVKKEPEPVPKKVNQENGIASRANRDEPDSKSLRSNFIPETSNGGINGLQNASQNNNNPLQQGPTFICTLL